MRRLLIACIAMAIATPALAAPRTSVAIDQTARVNLKGSAASVIVGNPSVADVTVVDERTLYLSGRGYGITEVVVLDPLGRTIWQGEVVVTAPTTGAVTIYCGGHATEMACANACSPSIRSAKAPASAPPTATATVSN